MIINNLYTHFLRMFWPDRGQWQFFFKKLDILSTLLSLWSKMVSPFLLSFENRVILVRNLNRLFDVLMSIVDMLHQIVPHHLGANIAYQVMQFAVEYTIKITRKQLAAFFVVAIKNFAPVFPAQQGIGVFLETPRVFPNNFLCPVGYCTNDRNILVNHTLLWPSQIKRGLPTK